MLAKVQAKLKKCFLINADWMEIVLAKVQAKFKMLAKVQAVGKMLSKVKAEKNPALG